MRILVDQSLPAALDHVLNAEGLTVERANGERSDTDLLRYAGSAGYSAVVLLDAEIVARPRILDLARDLGLTLICSVTNDPFEADTNLRHAFESLQTKVRQAQGPMLWLRRDGLTE